MTVLPVEENIESLDLLFMTDRKVTWYNFEKLFFNFSLSQDIFTQEKKKNICIQKLATQMFIIFSSCIEY